MRENSNNETEEVINAFNFSKPLIKALNFTQQIKEIEENDNLIAVKTNKINTEAKIKEVQKNNFIKAEQVISEERKLIRKPEKSNHSLNENKPASRIDVRENLNDNSLSDNLLTNEDNYVSEIEEHFVNQETNQIYSFDQMFVITAEEVIQENMLKLSGFEAIILKQAMAKFIISPEIRQFSQTAQNIIKSIPDNSNQLLNHVFELSKVEIEKLLQKLYEYNKIIRDNKLSPQKFKDCISLLFRTIQAEFFVKFSD